MWVGRPPVRSKPASRFQLQDTGPGGGREVTCESPAPLRPHGMKHICPPASLPSSKEAAPAEQVRKFSSPSGHVSSSHTLWYPRMFGRSGLPPVTWPQGQRWLLALLTLIASAVHLTRSPQAGGLGLPGTLLMQMASDTETAPPTHQHTADMDMTAMGDRAQETPLRTPHLSHHAPSPGLTDAAPNAPPAHDHHAGAHCPFCLTAGFALEAQTAFFIFQLPLCALHTALTCPRPFLARIRHADPRAPPNLQNSLT